MLWLVVAEHCFPPKLLHVNKYHALFRAIAKRIECATAEDLKYYSTSSCQHTTAVVRTNRKPHTSQQLHTQYNVAVDQETASKQWPPADMLQTPTLTLSLCTAQHLKTDTYARYKLLTPSPGRSHKPHIHIV